MPGLRWTLQNCQLLLLLKAFEFVTLKYILWPNTLEMIMCSPKPYLILPTSISHINMYTNTPEHTIFPIFPNKYTEKQKDQVTFPKSHSR